MNQGGVMRFGLVGLVVCAAPSMALAQSFGTPARWNSPTPAIGRTTTSYANPEILKGIDIDEKPGAPLPRELAFVDQDGNTVHLGDYLDGTHPLILVMAYYQCPMLCSYVINGLTDAMRALPWNAGDKYRAVAVSFDPRDTTELAAKKRANYVESYGKPVGPRGFDFLVEAKGDEASAKTLADTIGFRYRWDPKQENFAHAAGIFIFTPDGRLSRVLYGMEFPPQSMRLSLVEASDGKLGTLWDHVLLTCFHWDPNTRGYVLLGVRIMQAFGAVIVLALVLFLFRLWRRERHRRVFGPVEKTTT